MRLQFCQSVACVAAAIIVCLMSATSSVGQVIIVPGWGYPVFQENFDGNHIDPSIWQVADWPGNNNNESQYYHPNQVSVWGGALHLRADRDPNWTFGREYNSGLVRTWQEWSYGRVEVRARVPYGQGFWPAIWLLPRTAPWPAGGEIDIMEARGDLPWRISSAVHWGWDAASHQYVSQAYESGANFQAGYHIYAVEWDVGTVGFFVDGVEHMRVYEPAVGIPETAKSIVLNLAVGGDYSGYPDWTTPFPSEFDIDYVRVWQRSPPLPPPSSLIRDPGFEDEDGALAEWPRFGNAINNVISDWGTPLDGQRSLKMFGQFNGQENFSGVLQNHTANPGERFTVSAHALTRSEDSIVGTANEAIMKIEFYSSAGAGYGSTDFLGESAIVIADGNMPEDSWSHSELTATAPSSTVEARVTLQFKQPPSNPGGAVFVDSVTLARADAPVTVFPATVTPTRGTFVSGGLPELADSDNTDYSMQRANGDVQSRTELEVKGFSPVASPTSLEVTLEGSVFARTSVNQTIELFNYDSGQWESVDSRAAKRLTDSTVTVAVTGDLSRFVEPGTMCIEARVRYESANPRQRFSSNTDQFIWTFGQ